MQSIVSPTSSILRKDVLMSAQRPRIARYQHAPFLHARRQAQLEAAQTDWQA